MKKEAEEKLKAEELRRARAAVSSPDRCQVDGSTYFLMYGMFSVWPPLLLQTKVFSAQDCE